MARSQSDRAGQFSGGLFCGRALFARAESGYDLLEGYEISGRGVDAGAGIELVGGGLDKRVGLESVGGVGNRGRGAVQLLLGLASRVTRSLSRRRGPGAGIPGDTAEMEWSTVRTVTAPAED
ncbi:hypothetical protein chiPu_0015224 [Chiloscyllium punctatum]|uniref:Uncharacterized protein n=1 Tax=Chiloscyllium punctatum TaxID=137246 RepID=A0A401T252_CHIPU|nr:hypothetical protein [Chiloscyllium punctatum]